MGTGSEETAILNPDDLLQTALYLASGAVRGGVGRPRGVLLLLPLGLDLSPICVKSASSGMAAVFRAEPDRAPVPLSGGPYSPRSRRSSSSSSRTRFRWSTRVGIWRPVAGSNHSSRPACHRMSRSSTSLWL